MHRKSTHPASADPAPSGTGNACSNSDPLPMVSVLTELVVGYLRPAALLTDEGTILCMNAPAIEGPTDPKVWPRRAVIQVDGQTYTLTMPDAALEAANATPDPQLPPRLAKIARMVLAGCSDKQIALRTGLTFSTVRTYVRQIYRRLGVHNRVELVHAARGIAGRLA